MQTHGVGLLAAHLSESHRAHQEFEDGPWGSHMVGVLQEGPCWGPEYHRLVLWGQVDAAFCKGGLTYPMMWEQQGEEPARVVPAIPAHLGASSLVKRGGPVFLFGRSGATEGPCARFSIWQ